MLALYRAGRVSEGRSELTAAVRVLAAESGLDLQVLISQLTPKMRETIELVKLQGLSVSEAAARTAMSESAVKVSVHRGLKALAKLVRQRSIA